MKVRFEITLDIDADAWASEYGLSRDEVREDVRAYLTSGVTDWLGQQGLLNG